MKNLYILFKYICSCFYFNLSVQLSSKFIVIETKEFKSKLHIFIWPVLKNCNFDSIHINVF